jgi:hypothetical protein
MFVSFHIFWSTSSKFHFNLDHSLSSLAINTKSIFNYSINQSYWRSLLLVGGIASTPSFSPPPFGFPHYTPNLNFFFQSFCPTPLIHAFWFPSLYSGLDFFHFFPILTFFTFFHNLSTFRSIIPIPHISRPLSKSSPSHSLNSLLNWPKPPPPRPNN